MGQYHSIFNLDKKEVIRPHGLGDGTKLVEWWGSYPAMGLSLLLACTNGETGRGGGDWKPWVEGVSEYLTAETYGADRMVDFDAEDAKAIASAIPGRWAGDRIAVVGDYMEEGDLDLEHGDPYRDESYTDISDVVFVALSLDHYTGQRIKGDDWAMRKFEEALDSFKVTLKTMQEADEARANAADQLTM